LSSLSSIFLNSGISSFCASLLLLAVSVRAKAALHLITVLLSFVFSKSPEIASLTLFGNLRVTVPIILASFPFHSRGTILEMFNNKVKAI